MPARTVLAFDIGTTGTKAALIDGQGHILRSVVQDYAKPTFTAEGGIAEQDARDWWEALVTAARQIDAASAEAIVLTGQMQNVILVDADGEPVRPVILYSDSRARAEAEEVGSMLGAKRLRLITGNDQGAGSLLAKLRWLHHHEAWALYKARWLLCGAADYAALRLTGAAASDTTTASTTGLMDLDMRQWLTLDDLSALAGRDMADLLPPLVAGGAQVGTLTPAAAEQLGLRAGLPVHLGPGDAGAATLGAGAGALATPYAYIGTSGWVGYSDGRRADPLNGVFTLAHPDPTLFICVAPMLTAGGNLDWIKGVLSASSHAALIDSALAAPTSRLLYLPYLNGERSPFSDPQAAGAFIGLRPTHDGAALTRAVLEGVAFAYRHALDALLTTPPLGLTLTGGGTRSSGWCQLIADITGLPVAAAEDAQNVGVRGALLAAQVANGERPDYAPAGFFPVAARFTPRSAQRDHYNTLYAVFREAYPALKATFARL